MAPDPRVSSAPALDDPGAEPAPSAETDASAEQPPAAPPAAPPTTGLESRPGQPTPPKPPSAYRPDLRPMLILFGLLAVVIVGWILLGQLILPPAR